MLSVLNRKLMLLRFMRAWQNAFAGANVEVKTYGSANQIGLQPTTWFLILRRVETKLLRSFVCRY